MKDRNSTPNTGKDTSGKTAPSRIPEYGSSVKPFSGADPKSREYQSSSKDMKKDASADSSKNTSWKNSNRK